MFESRTDLVEIVLWDRGSAVSLMEHLSRYRSFLVEPDGYRWVVFARCGKRHPSAELLEQVDAWASTHHRTSPTVRGSSAGQLTR